jgi:WD40 repeat protein
MRPDIPPSLASHLDAFETAWQQPVPPRLEDYLPPESEPGRAEVLVSLVRIDLEHRIKAGEPVRIESYLSRFPELRESGEGVLGLVMHEYDLRHRQDPAVNAEEYFTRFPEFTSELWMRWQTVPPTGEGGVSVAAPPQRAQELDLRSYELLDRVGRGGMGEVYRGKDPALGRDLAVKVLRPEWRGDADAQRRFEQEARVTGALQHPNIVPVHNLGRLPDGRLYFTMKLVGGRTFAEMLAEGRDSSRLPELLGVFEKVCQAIAFAHSRGVIHRDLKPSNVMVGAFGEVQVMDWGLAKVRPREFAAAPGDGESGEGGDTVRRISATGSTADDRRTGTVGTPSYMPPEQARGSGGEVDERADVFGLGAILCEVLTGRPPYAGERVEDILDKASRAATEDALGRLAGCGAGAELVALCKECLDGKAEERPRDGRAVAERISAYQAGVQERLRKAELERAAAEARAAEARAKVVAERRARRLAVGLAVAGAAFVVLLGAAAVALTISAARQKDLTRTAEDARSDAQEEARQKGEQRDRAEAALKKSRWQTYAGVIALAYREWQDGDLWRARATLDLSDPELRGWEYDFLLHICEGSPTALKSPAIDVAFTADGKDVVILSPESGCDVWNPSTGERSLGQPVKDGQYTRKMLGPGGTRVLCYQKGLGAKVWDGRTGKELFVLHEKQEVVAAAFSADGRRIATSDGNRILLWDAGTGASVAILELPRFGVSLGTLGFSGDGGRLAAGGLYADAIRVWDVATGKMVLALAGDVASKRQTVAVCLNSDGSRAASIHVNPEAGTVGDPGTIRVWDVNQGRMAFVVPQNRVGFISLVFSPDGRHLVAGRGDGPVVVWDAGSGREVRCLRGHFGPPGRLAFGPDGRLVSAEAPPSFFDPMIVANQREGLARSQGAVKVWDINNDPEVTRITDIEGGLTSLAFSPDGWLLAGGGDRVGIWEVEGRRPIKNFPIVGASIYQVAFSADARKIAAGRSSGDCYVWEVETGKEKFRWEAPQGASGVRFAGVAYSSDGKYLAIGHSKGVTVRDPETFEEVVSLTGGPAGGGISFSRDGSKLVGGGHDESLKVWDLDSRDVVLRQDSLGGLVRGGCFSPDGRLLACVTPSPSVKVWDTKKGELAFTLEGHLANVFSVCFSPDGKRIATTSRDRTVKIWSAASGQELLTLPGLTYLPWCVTFSPDGRRLATGGASGPLTAAILLWDTGSRAGPLVVR